MKNKFVIGTSALALTALALTACSSGSTHGASASHSTASSATASQTQSANVPTSTPSAAPAPTQPAASPTATPSKRVSPWHTVVVHLKPTSTYLGGPMVVYGGALDTAALPAGEYEVVRMKQLSQTSPNSTCSKALASDDHVEGVGQQASDPSSGYHLQGAASVGGSSAPASAQDWQSIAPVGVAEVQGGKPAHLWALAYPISGAGGPCGRQEVDVAVSLDLKADS